MSTPEEVRALIAAAVTEHASAPSQLGDVRLREHQRVAVGRIRDALQHFGGALLADAVGLGKTYVGLAVASAYERPLVIAPAVLRSTWAEAARKAGVEVGFASAESLSRAPPRQDCGFVVVDEAHHFRTPTTRRYSRLAELTATVPVLLLTATPIHNRYRDLAALLALFLGSRGTSLSNDELAKCVLRREHPDVPALRLPRLQRVKRVEIESSTAVATTILSLPPPVPLRDGSSSTALVRLGLLHMWASSDAALSAGLRRRMAAAVGIRQALERGLVPSRRELGAWVSDTHAVQLGFTELLVEPHCHAPHLSISALDQHVQALKALAELVGSEPGRDEIRCERLREIRLSDSAAKVVAFSAYSETVHALFSAIAAEGEVAVVSGKGGRISSGRLTCDEVLRTFRAPSHARERIQLLLATDLLSEGLNLPEASVIVHLDLPWTAARMEQRVGRLRRLDSPKRVIASYVFTQPPAVERILRKELLLAAKAQAAASAVGQIFPGGAAEAAEISPARAAELTRQLVLSWRAPTRPTQRSDVPARRAPSTSVAAVRCEVDGFLALIRTGERTRLVCGTGRDDASFDPRAVYALLLHASRETTTVTSGAYLRARRGLRHRLAAESMHTAIGGGSPPHVVVRAQLLLRSAVANAPPHERARTASRVASLLPVLSGRLTAGLERRLDRLIADAESATDFVAGCEELLVCRTEAGAVHAHEVAAVLLLVRTGEQTTDQRSERAKVSSRLR